jgi:hypothetical protein
MSTSHNIVHLPTQPEMEEAKISSRMLSKYADADRVQMTLKASNGQAEDLVLPGPVLQMLLDILSEMARGNAISLMPIHHELSTQEAANLLNVSRPHLVSSAGKGQLAVPQSWFASSSAGQGRAGIQSQHRPASFGHLERTDSLFARTRHGIRTLMARFSVILDACFLHPAH